MAKQYKVLGTVSAYGLAKLRGYDGTLAEFAEGLIKSAQFADNAEASAEAAAASAAKVVDIYVDGTSLVINTHVVNGNEVRY